jgi:hypothetical protein
MKRPVKTKEQRIKSEALSKFSLKDQINQFIGIIDEEEFYCKVKKLIY